MVKKIKLKASTLKLLDNFERAAQERYWYDYKGTGHMEVLGLRADHDALRRKMELLLARLERKAAIGQHHIDERKRAKDWAEAYTLPDSMGAFNSTDPI